MSASACTMTSLSLAILPSTSNCASVVCTNALCSISYGCSSVRSICSCDTCTLAWSSFESPFDSRSRLLSLS